MGKFSIEPFLPEHLKREPKQPEREQDQAEVAMNWKLLRGAFKSGKIKQG
jgi:hypothetical protein